MVKKVSAHVVGDNGGDNFSQLHNLIFVALRSYNCLSKIALAVDKDKSNVHRSLKSLVKMGLVERLGSDYILSGRGQLLIQRGGLSPVESSIQVTTSKVLEDVVDCHDISFNVLLWSVPDGWLKWLNTCCGLHLDKGDPGYPRELGRVARKWGVNREFRNWEPVDITLFNGFSFRVHPKGVLVHVPSVVADKPSVAARIAVRRLVSVLPKLERWLKLSPTSLYKSGRLNIQLKSAHYALFEKEFTSWFVNVEGERKKFAVRGDDGNLLLFMDLSHPLAIESRDPVKGELATDWVQDYFRPIAEGRCLRPDLVKSRVEGLESDLVSIGGSISDLNKATLNMQSEVMPVMKDFAVHTKTHSALMKDSAKLSKANIQAADSLNLALDRIDKILDFFFRPFVWLGGFWSWVKGIF